MRRHAEARHRFIIIEAHGNRQMAELCTDRVNLGYFQINQINAAAGITAMMVNGTDTAIN